MRKVFTRLSASTHAYLNTIQVQPRLKPRHELTTMKERAAIQPPAEQGWLVSCPFTAEGDGDIEDKSEWHMMLESFGS